MDRDTRHGKRQQILTLVSGSSRTSGQPGLAFSFYKAKLEALRRLFFFTSGWFCLNNQCICVCQSLESLMPLEGRQESLLGKEDMPAV